MRTLYYVPMIHSLEELGSLTKNVKINLAEMSRNKDLKEYWDEVRRRLRKEGLYGPKSRRLHIFVDGLPNVDEDTVRKVADDLIASGTSHVYRTIADLQKHGAVVHGTENLRLMIEEYEYFKGLTDGVYGNAELSAARLIARDTAIAVRIQEVMTDEDDIGILFAGLAHDIVRKLPKEFVVVVL